MRKFYIAICAVLVVLLCNQFALAGEITGRIVYNSKNASIEGGAVIYSYTLRVRDHRGKLHTIYVKAEKNSTINDALSVALKGARNVRIEYYEKGLKKYAVQVISIGPISSVEYSYNLENNSHFLSATGMEKSINVGNNGIDIPRQ